jgi:hypothetical protein
MTAGKAHSGITLAQLAASGRHVVVHVDIAQTGGCLAHLTSISRCTRQ